MFPDDTSVPSSPLKMGHGTDRLSQNICNYQSVLRNIPEEKTLLSK